MVPDPTKTFLERKVPDSKELTKTFLERKVLDSKELTERITKSIVYNTI